MKKLKTVPKHFKIPTILKKWLNDNSISAAQLLRNFIELTSSERADLKEAFNLLDFKDIFYDFFPDYITRNNLSDIEIRINAYIEAAICTLTERTSEEKQDISDAVKIILCLEYGNHNPKPSQPRMALSKKSYTSKIGPLLHVMGEKSWFKPEFLHILEQLPGYINDYADIFGGSGYLAVLAYQSEKFNKIIYNDDDTAKHNFFDVVSKWPADFKAACLCENLPKSDQNPPSDDSAIIAAADLFLKSRLKNTSIEKQLDALQNTSKAFQNIKRCSDDGLGAVQKNHKKSNFLLVVDPPYSNTNDYCSRKSENPQKAFLDKDHRKLAKLLIKSNATFLYFCRATFKRDFSNSAKILLEDARRRGESEDLFANQHLFVRDFLYRNNGVIERVISNFPFENFSQFEFQNSKDPYLFFGDD